MISSIISGMTSWIVEQQVIFSFTLLAVILIEHLWSNKLAPKVAYGIWAIVPIILVVNNIPTYFIDISSIGIQQYSVGVNPSIQTPSYKWFWLIWLIGALTISMLVLTAYIRLYFSLQTSFKSEPNIRFSNAVTSPILIGVIKPKILLPRNFESHFNPDQQRMIIEHEKVHWRSLDHLWNLIALMLLVLFWFNPLTWIACRFFRINQEIACDSIVLAKKTETEKLLYAKALVQCAELTTLSTLTFAPYPKYGDKYAMLKRLNLIENPTSTNKVTAYAIALFIGLFVVNTAVAQLKEVPVQKDSTNEAVPVVRINPVYPKEAVDKGLEGSVILRFDITQAGKTANIHVVESFPEDVFDSSAKEALTEWKYKPKIIGGKPLKQTDLLVQLDFKLQKSVKNIEVVETFND